MSCTPHIGFVLSAGRTGTVFLTNALAQADPPVHAVHEPDGSRSTLMLANLRNATGVGDRAVANRFEAGLARRLSGLNASDVYVEFNPMLCSCTEVLERVPGSLRVVHLVRSPASWVRSILAFRASGWRRHAIEYTPFANPYPWPRPTGWVRMDRVERALWRWRYCNEQLLAVESRCDRYVRVRHEDLFSDSPEHQRTTLQTVFNTLELSGELPELSVLPPANPAPATREPIVVDDALVAQICGPLLTRLGYATR